MQEELKIEIVSLRGKLQSKDIKKNFEKSTKILDHIISIQRLVYDKSGLGYNPKMGSSSKILENGKRSYANIVKSL